MASNLRKYKYTGKATSASATPANETASGPPSSAPSMLAKEQPASMEPNEQLDRVTDLKSEILSSIKAEMTELFQSELAKVIAKEFGEVKMEMQAVRVEIANSTATFRSELDTIKTSVSDIEQGLSGCSDDITALQESVQRLEKHVTALQDKCVDMEGRMRRSNIRILNVAEEIPSTPVSVSKLLREVLKMDKDVLIDRSHRTLQTRQAGGKPRAIIAKIHYYQDCVDIFRRARAASPLLHNGSTILIFPDYPPSVANARSAFNDVKKLLRGRDNVRYGILHPAQLRITHNGIEKRFRDAAQAMTYVKDNIL
ncbi:hypothetical protein WMY93_003486 [Mugilogobius chulae]|uniref:Transposase element L1Md-A101/L1Md-A102/L1Md-A2 n=1 Tax=Mugilogobius chulae TaxID=88201 RepID=A0AAW0Q517_9GOBI